MIIETERLEIHSLSEAHAEFIQLLVNSEGWLRFIGQRNVHSYEEAIAYIQKIEANTNVNYYVVHLQSTKLAVGLITLIQRDYLEYPDFGFAFLPEFNGLGLAYEASEAMLHYFKSIDPSQRILAITLTDNQRSIHLLNKLGFEFEEKIIQDKDELNVFVLN